MVLDSPRNGGLQDFAIKEILVSAACLALDCEQVAWQKGGSQAGGGVFTPHQGHGVCGREGKGPSSLSWKMGGFGGGLDPWGFRRRP